MTGEDHDHRALFAHVGVTDLTDWKTVALRLAEQHVPEVLQGKGARKRGPGRPGIWGHITPFFALRMVEETIQASQEGTIRPRLPDNKAACRFLTGGSPEAKAILARHFMPEPITESALYNRVCAASAYEKRQSQKL